MGAFGGELKMQIHFEWIILFYIMLEEDDMHKLLAYLVAKLIVLLSEKKQGYYCPPFNGYWLMR